MNAVSVRVHIVNIRQRSAVLKSAPPNSLRREQAADEIVLGLLDAVERDPIVTQRSVAGELDIALGLANAYLKRCVRKGLIKVTQIPSRRYAYYLTPKGFSEKSRLTANYLSYSFAFFRNARMQCDQIYKTALSRRQQSFALVGPGDLAEIAKLVAVEHPVRIAGIVRAELHDGSLVSEIERLGGSDAIIVTALQNSREIYASVLNSFDESRVYAPPLLRLQVPSSNGDASEEGRR